jgi:HEAT repeat protein
LTLAGAGVKNDPVLDRRGCWFVAAIALLGAAPARAADSAPAPAGETFASLTRQLASEDDDAAISAARKLGELGGAGALVSALAMGLRPAVATEALGGLGKTRDPRVLAVVTLYAGNVNLPVRLAAVKSLGRLPDARVTDLLLERLGDAHPQVRAAAGEALAARKVARAEERLFRLVARNDASAAGPLGALIAPSAIPRLTELHGRIDDGVLATALGEFLKRPEVPDRLRVDVVRTVGRLPGVVATAALVEYLAAVPDKDQRPSKEEAQRLLDQRGAK